MKRKRPLALVLVLAGLVLANRQGDDTAGAELLAIEEHPNRSAAGTWDDGRSMAEVAQADYLARAGWWDTLLFGHWLLFDTERTRAITWSGELRR